LWLQGQLHFEVLWHKVYLISSKLIKPFNRVVGLLKHPRKLNIWWLPVAALVLVALDMLVAAVALVAY
tara:strand:+ start:94 stop:297 length:204 start_codon:yes stop_codon:yes gene_type:complete